MISIPRFTKERSLLAQISHAKDELITPEEMELNAGGDWDEKEDCTGYTRNKSSWRNNALDFDDLIVKTVELFQNTAGCAGILSGTFQIYHGG